MIVREITISDSEKLAKLTNEVEKSSKYMLWEAGERNIQTDNQKEMIKSMKAAGNSTILVAEKDNGLVGFLFAIGGNARRNRHSTYIVIGILKGYRGQGIGIELFNKLVHWAENNNVSRLELTVVTKNEAGLSLYKKVGFEIEGTKRNALFIDGAFVDEYYMSKIL
ncbi:GNAT family N-acetyltransferase [Paraliobacillus sediminis]|uniref:GNAT family N-acetyltransferase n=1 Tax=Paraliobacillus sediminis TaxID=1885916 RepID=UPI000E3C8E09|nr:GNAT family N-acetyltransferase [Paraliobacillus sediminis]